ncbi:hypothetical protein GH733_013746, partial [Mirounga leonina]
MHPSLLLAALCLGTTTAAPEADQSSDARWSRWKAAHGKLYDENEEGWRRAVWAKNMQMIERHNQEYSQGKHSFAMAMNAFGDLTSEEFRQVMNGLQIQTHEEGNEFQAPPSAETPSSVDWREKDYVTPVKDQDKCSGKLANVLALSEQNLVDCCLSRDHEGCSSGLMGNTFPQYVKDNRSLDSEESYPYHAQ